MARSVLRSWYAHVVFQDLYTPEHAGSRQMLLGLALYSGIPSINEGNTTMHTIYIDLIP